MTAANYPEHERQKDWSRRLGWLFPVCFTLAALLIQVQVGAFATDRGQTADEAAHFVTSLMIADYLHHLGNPIAFAKNYYVHLPRVAIGHWPPFFETIQAAAFVLFGGSNIVAIALQAVIAGLMAGLPALLMTRQQGVVAGILTGLIILSIRPILFLLDTDMADNLLGLLVFLSAWAWSVFYARPSVFTAAGFAAAVAAAILTKGTAIGLLALPLIYLSVRRDLRFLFRRQTIGAMTAILLLVVPWYVATYRLAASGWNYSWGSFTVVAGPYFWQALLVDFGLLALIGFAVGAVRALQVTRSNIDMAAFAVTAIIQFVFILIVPADLNARYLVPIFPCAAMVAVWGLFTIVEEAIPRIKRGGIVSLGLTSTMVLMTVWQTFGAPHVESFRTQEAFSRIAPHRNPLVLVSGSARFEGAMIATAAAADRGSFFYMLRASKFLSTSTFMGNDYRLRFSRADDLKSWLLQSQIGFIVLDTSVESMKFAHNVILLNLMKNDPEDFHQVWRGIREDGTIALFVAAASREAPRNPGPLVKQQAPGGVP